MSDDPEQFLDSAPSKSERKREMHALQALGEQLVNLKSAQWAEFPLTDDLLRALAECQRLAHSGARQRQLRYIGKLLREVDIDAVRQIYERITAPQRHDRYLHQLCESWRERLLTGDPAQITAFIDAYPHVDRQPFRQLVARAVAEHARNGASLPPRQSRALFQLIREVIIAAE